MICLVNGSMYKLDSCTLSILLEVQGSTLIASGTISLMSMCQSSSKYLAVSGGSREIAVYNMEEGKLESRAVLDAGVVSIEWAGSCALLVGDSNGSVHLFA